MSILDGATTQAEKDQLLAAVMDPKVLEYCEQLKNQGVDFQILRVSKEDELKGETVPTLS